MSYKKIILYLMVFLSLEARENYIDKPTPMEWYRGCTTTATSILLDWFGNHGYWRLNGTPTIASFSGCHDAYIRNDIATIYANELGLNCTTNQGASPNEIQKGIEKVLTSLGYCVNKDKSSCFQIINHRNLTVQDLMNSIDKGYPLTLGVDSSTLKNNFNFDTDFNRSINHRVVAYGYKTSSKNIKISLLSGWSRNWQDATKEIFVSGDENTIIQERALYITPPYSFDARMITRASAIKRIFDSFNIPNKFGLDSSFSSSRPSDIDNTTSYYKYIATAYNKNIVHGYTIGDLRGKYGAFYSVNRAEFIKMVMQTLNKYWGLPISSSSMSEPVNIFGNRFPDMNYNSWYYKYVKAAYNYGIIQGTQDGKLQPDVKLSEYEAKIILERAKKYATSSKGSSGSSSSSSSGRIAFPGWNYCTSSHPCSVGYGDCDSNSECQTNLICKQDVGSKYGWSSNVDVCEVDSSTSSSSSSSGSSGDGKDKGVIPSIINVPNEYTVNIGEQYRVYFNVNKNGFTNKSIYSNSDGSLKSEFDIRITTTNGTKKLNTYNRKYWYLDFTSTRIGRVFHTFQIYRNNRYYNSLGGITIIISKPLIPPVLKLELKNNSINISWNSVSGATQYQLVRSTSPNGSYIRLYCGSLKNYSDSKDHLIMNQMYYYKVKAGPSKSSCYGDAYWSNYSAYKSIKLSKNIQTVRNPSIVKLEIKKESNFIKIKADYISNDGSAIDISYLKIISPSGKTYFHSYDTEVNYHNGHVTYTRHYDKLDIFDISGIYRIELYVKNKNGLISNTVSKNVYINISKKVSEISITNFKYTVVKTNEKAGTAYLHITSTISNENSSSFYDNGNIKSLDSGTAKNGYVTLNSGKHIIKVCANNGGKQICSNEKTIIVAKKVEDNLYKKLPLEAKSNGLSNDGTNLIYGTKGGNIYRLNIKTKESIYIGDVNERVSGLYYINGYIYYSNILSGQIRVASLSQEISHNIAKLPFPDGLDYYRGRLYVVTNDRSGILAILNKTTGIKVGTLNTGIDDIVGITHTDNYLYILSENGDIYQTNSNTGHSNKIFNNNSLFEKGNNDNGLEAITILNNRIYVSYTNDSSIYLIDVDLSNYE